MEAGRRRGMDISGTAYYHFECSPYPRRIFCKWAYEKSSGYNEVIFMLTSLLSKLSFTSISVNCSFYGQSISSKMSHGRTHFHMSKNENCHLFSKMLNYTVAFHSLAIYTVSIY